jgi:Putative Ig domain/Abnormal spindle-like microcephaly-assoc'd, ASPM-SPD-2-Hydin/Transmembrane protein 131-like N-terminal
VSKASIIVASWLLAVGGIALASGQSFSITPSSLNFQPQTVGTSSQNTVTLLNNGHFNITLNSFTITPSEFQLVNGYAPGTLAPERSIYFTIKFVPDAAQSFTGQLTLNIEGFAPQVIPLSGTGLATGAIASLNTTALDFGSVTQATTGPAQTVSVSNTGTSSFQLLAVDTDPPFTASGFTNAVTVKPGSSTSVQVSMSGAAVGSYAGELALTFDVLPPQSVSLAGTTATASSIAVATFPTLPYATPGAPYLVTLIGYGGTSPYTWQIAPGSALPSGLSLSATGSLTGTLSSSTAVGNYTFSVQLTDSSSHTTTAQLTLPVTLAATKANCNDIEYPNSSAPYIPINDLGTGTFMGEEGGLYPNGSNVRPASHDASGVAIAQAIQPLDTSGNVNPNGKYVLLSIGMSETQQEFGQFTSDANTDPTKNPHLVVVNGAQDAIVASDWADITFGTWTSITNYILPEAGLSGNQVVAAWVKSLDTPHGTFPSDETPTQTDLESIAQNLHTLFPNLKLAYFATTIYGGYGDGTGSGADAEPNSYEGGFAVKWAIQDQINGNANLNFDPAMGPVVAPWMSWGSYDWSNGLLARSDGLVWTCAEYSDGIHPNTLGRETVSNLMLTFFKIDDTTRPWFLDPAKLVFLSSNSLVFGNQVVGTTSNSQNVTLTNNQALPLNVSSIATTGDFAQSNSCSSSLAAGASCTISVTFKPTTTGNRAGSLTITDDAASSPQAVSLSGTGIASAAPAVGLSSASLTFTAQPVGSTSAAQVVTVTNTGTANLIMTSISASGDYAEGNTCAGVSLQPLATCVISITLTPSVSGTIAGVVTLVDNAANAPQLIALSGSGVYPITVTPATVSYGTVAVGTTSPAKTLTISNHQTQTLNLGFASSGDFSATGSGTTPCGSTLHGNSRCTLSVTFTPTVNGAIQGALTISSSAAFSPQTVGLSGSGSGGTAAPFNFSPTSAQFGNVAVGATSSTVKVTVTNTSGAAVNISSFAASGTFFASSGTPACSGSLAAGTKCVLLLTFSPVVPGSVTGALTLNDSGSNSPQTLKLIGTGVLPVTLSPASLVFPAQSVGTTSAAQTVTITNEQAAILTLNAPAASGDYIVVTAGSTPCGATLAALASCTVGVEFSPTATGTISGALTVSYAGGFSPQEVSLSGAGR